MRDLQRLKIHEKRQQESYYTAKYSVMLLLKASGNDLLADAQIENTTCEDMKELRWEMLK